MNDAQRRAYKKIVSGVRKVPPAGPLAAAMYNADLAEAWSRMGFVRYDAGCNHQADQKRSPSRSGRGFVVIRSIDDRREDQRDREVGRNGEHVPKQRGVKVWPQGTESIWQWKCPICKPDTTHVKYREEACTHYRKNSHRFC